MNTDPSKASSSDNPGAGIDYQRFLDCVHCGLCTAACPTYVELGNENDSPRGRIYLMRAVTDERIGLTPEVQHHLELCLDCRACETACPSGVQYGRLIEPFRLAMDQHAAHPKNTDWFHRWILFGLFPYASRLRLALWPARVAQRLGLDRWADQLGLLNLLPSQLRQMARMLPPPVRYDTAELPELLPAIGRRRARVALFTGCVGDVMFRHTNWATARVLQQNGCDVLVPREQVCCGAIHFHAGNDPPARTLANQNLAAFPWRSVDAVIANVAGCGAMLKDYGHHWHDQEQSQRTEFARKVKDVHEFLDQLGVVPPVGKLPHRVTYHDACHLVHAQRIREAPRNLLRQIPGLQLVDVAEGEICCGAAGTYNLTQPEMAGRLGQRKLQNVLQTRAEVLASPNAGCSLHLAAQARQAGHQLRVMHPMELLDLSYRQLPLPG